MSWLARSLATSLQPAEASPPVMAESEGASVSDPGISSGTPAQGVRDDLSDLSKTFTRHFKGVASFLAPPSHGSSSDQDPCVGVEVEDPDFESTAGFDISKIRSSFLQLKSQEEDADEYDEEEEEEEEEEGELEEEVEVGVSGDLGFDAIGITVEVLAFARNISMHPETWLDFPLLPDEDEPDSLFSYFEMSVSQIEHAMTIERLAPRLAALRIELCPIHMSQDCFWKIYFVLLHPRLNKNDADLLSTPQIVEARTMLMQSLHSKTKSEIPDSSAFSSTDIEAEKYQAQSTTEMQVVDNCVIKEDVVDESNRSNFVQKFEVENDSDDDWFNNESKLQEGIGTIHIGAGEDVSFSDLENDDFL